jgi:hypothetical protein
VWFTAVSEDKSIVKIETDTEGIKNTPIQVCKKLHLLVDLQQKVEKLVLSATSSPSIVIVENTLN